MTYYYISMIGSPIRARAVPIVNNDITGFCLRQIIHTSIKVRNRSNFYVRQRIYVSIKVGCDTCCVRTKTEPITVYAYKTEIPDCIFWKTTRLQSVTNEYGTRACIWRFLFSVIKRPLFSRIAVIVNKRVNRFCILKLIRVTLPTIITVRLPRRKLIP